VSVGSWLAEPWQTGFVMRAFVAVILVGIVGGALGGFVVVRGLAFTGEAFAHTVFPGAVVATMAGFSVTAGGLAFGLASAGAIALAARVPKVGAEAAIGIVFVGAFALGAILLSTEDAPARDLESFLFGSLLGVTRGDLLLTAGAAAAVLAGLAALWRPLVLSSFDRPAAAAMGVRLGYVDAALLVMLALAVVVALGAVGNVLVLAMLVTPAATARLAGLRMAPTVALGAALGAAEGAAGLYLSYYGDVAAGGAVVLVATGVFAAALLVAPRGLLLPRLRRASTA
jgi:manganese/iron transport system permease protein